MTTKRGTRRCPLSLPRGVAKFHRLFIPIIALSLLSACQSNGQHEPAVGKSATEEEDTPSGREISYVAADDLPRHVAVLEPEVEGDTVLEPEMAGLIQGVLRNYLVGMGYRLADENTVEQCWERQTQEERVRSPTVLIECLETADVSADGVVSVKVYEFKTINIGFLEHYALDARVTLSDSEGKELGTWQDRSTRRKVAVAIDPLSAVLTLATSAVTARGGVHRRDVIYDWAFNITALMPSVSRSSKRPQVLRVVTNIEDRPFKQGEQIAAGFEGDRGMRAVFEIGDFRKDVPMVEKEPGVYMGTYVVREGDLAKSQSLILRLAAADGSRHDWPVTEQLVSIDGQAPSQPESLRVQLTGDGVVVGWQSTDPEVAQFIVYRSLEPLSGYEEQAKVQQLEWRDTSVAAGTGYYYRVLSEDHVGNLSPPVQSQPVFVPVAGRPILSGELQGHLAAGNYLLQGEAVVPVGGNLELSPGVSIVAEAGARLVVSGTLSGREVTFRVSPEEKQDDDSTREVEPSQAGPGLWKGIVVEESGRIKLEKSTWRECVECVVVKGTAEFRQCQWQDGNTGLSVRTSRKVSIDGGRFQRLATALFVEDGHVEVRRITVTENQAGIRIEGGSLSLTESNLYGNKVNLDTTVPLTLKQNFLGSVRPNRLGVRGPITLRSLLDAQWPDGKEITADQEAFEKTAAEQTERGIAAFNEQRYGQAYEYLTEALDYDENRTTRLYLAYVLAGLNKNEELDSLLKDAIARYPYEVRFYNLAVRNLLTRGQTEQARELVDHALKLNPGNPNLEGLKVLVEN